MMVFLLGWRNLWRNPLRSVITIGGVASGYAVLMFLISLTEGMLDQMLNNGTDLLVGHVQIQHRDYLPDRDLYETLGGSRGTDWRALAERLLGEPEVVAATARIHASGLASTGENSAGVAIVGIDPVQEAKVSGLQGQGSPKDLHGRGLLLGDALRQELAAGGGSEIALVTQAADGTIGNDLYRNRGTLDTGMALLDRSLTLVHLEDLQELMALAPGRIHEIALKLRDPGAAEAVAARLNDSAVLPPDAVARSWRSLLPTLSDYLDMATASYVLMIGLVALFAALGVLNTMLMSVFERVRELGMLSALGMRPARGGSYRPLREPCSGGGRPGRRPGSGQPAGVASEFHRTGPEILDGRDIHCGDPDGPGDRRCLVLERRVVAGRGVGSVHRRRLASSGAASRIRTPGPGHEKPVESLTVTP